MDKYGNVLLQKKTLPPGMGGVFEVNGTRVRIPRDYTNLAEIPTVLSYGFGGGILTQAI